MYAIELAKFLMDSADDLLGAAEMAEQARDERVQEAAELLHLGSRILNRVEMMQVMIEPVIQEAA